MTQSTFLKPRVNTQVVLTGSVYTARLGPKVFFSFFTKIHFLFDR